MDQFPVMEAKPRKNWFERNWKWFVPLVCLWGVAVVGGFLALILYLVFGLMKTSDAYKEALARAKANPAVVAALGTPIKEGFFVAGVIKVSGPSGEARLEIPLSGPGGKGTIFLEAVKSAGKWNFSKLVVEIESTGERIDLLRPGEAPENQEGVPRTGPAISI